MWDCIVGGEAEEGHSQSLAQPSAAAEPGESAFDDPALGQDDEVLGVIRPFDDLDRHLRKHFT
jgi:hypothetical protein